MGQIIPTAISDFSLGMTNDPRTPDTRYCRMCEHFDLTDAHRLIPYHASENGDTSASTNQLAYFEYANGKLYGLSAAAGSSQKLLTKSSNTTQTWDVSLPSNMNISAAYNGVVFRDFHGALFMSRAAQIDSYTYGSSSLALNVNSGNYVATGQAVVHRSGKKMYIPCGSNIVSFDGSTWNSAALALDSFETIIALCPQGNNLAIVLQPLYTGGPSRVFIWDRDETQSGVSEAIDFGEGTLKVIQESDSGLVGVSVISGSSSAFKDYLVVSEWTGGIKASEVRRLTFDGTTIALSSTVQRTNKGFYFLMQGAISSTYHAGVWFVGRQSPGLPLQIALDRLAVNDSSFVAGSTLNGFIKVQDFFYISYIISATYGMSKTDDQAAYTASSAYESVIFNSVLGLRNKHIPDSTQIKDFVGASVTTEPLPSGGQVLLKYKTDAQTSWSSTVLTHSGTDAIHKSVLQTSAKIPQHKEIQWRLESTGGAVITGFKFHQEITGKDLY